MKKLITTIFLWGCIVISFGQKTHIKLMVDSLQYLNADTLDCKADLYWRIIFIGDKAIPFLIDKLTDTTQTKIKFHCKRTRLNVGEIAQFALTQIATFPYFLITKIQFDYFYCDETGQFCSSFDDYFFINTNKLRYQSKLKNWYAKQKAKYKPVKISVEKQTECQKQYRINKYYHWTE